LIIGFNIYIRRDKMSKSDQINELNDKLNVLTVALEEADAENVSLRRNLNNSTSELNALITRLIEAVIEESHDNDYCVDGQIDFLKKVIGDLRSSEYIKSHFHTDLRLTVNFRLIGAGATLYIEKSEIVDFLETQFETNVEVTDSDIIEE
jgi:hypothetical protein